MLRLARAPETRHATPGQENYDAAKAHMARAARGLTGSKPARSRTAHANAGGCVRAGSYPASRLEPDFRMRSLCRPSEVL